MRTSATMQVSGLNLVMPAPHSPKRYIQALRRASRQKKHVKLHGDYYGVFASARYDEDERLVSGFIHRYFNFEAVQDWYNMQEGKQADPQEVKESVVIPDHLKPHLVMAPYVFFPREHQLYYVNKEKSSAQGISVSQVKKLLDKTFELPKMVEEFGLIDTSVLPNPAEVEEILGMEHLRYLKLSIKLPNPDIPDRREEILRRMEEENAREYEEEMKAANEDGLKPDKQRRIDAAIAAQHGYVEGRGDHDEVAGKAVTRSTLSKPLDEPAPYNPNTETVIGVLREKARLLVQRFADQRGNG